MDVQMREQGFGDPSLGKQVRMMVGALASRIDRWRRAVEAIDPWDETARISLYGETVPDGKASEQAVEATKLWWQRLQAVGDSALMTGQIR